MNGCVVASETTFLKFEILIQATQFQLAKRMKVSIGIAFLLLHQSRGEVNTVPLPTNLQCPSSQVFDFTGLVCTDCDSTKSSGLQPDLTSAHTCKCPPSLVQNNVECSIESMWQGTCNTASCSSECSLLSQVSSLDQQTCILCQGNSSHYESSEYDIDFKECTCKNPAKGPATGKPVVTRKLVEIYDNITGLPSRNDCMRCPDGTAVISKELYNNGQFYSTAGATYIADPYSCSYCPDAHMFFDTDYNCVCPDGFVLTGEASVGKQSCIYHYPSVSGGSKVGFQDTISIGSESRGAYDFTLDSIVFSHYYLKAASHCEYYKGTFEDLQSCQTLSNLCVMSMYDEAAPACKQLQIISQRRQGTYHKQEDWIYSLPWLYYDNEPTDDRGLQMKMAFHPVAYHTNSLIFKLFKYTLNGTFVGVESLNSQLEFCFDSMSRDGSQPQV